jgi:thiol-disulfide isomerase/thioredoxin
MTNFFEDLLLNIGLSWTLSKYIPYIFCLLIGFLLFKIWVKITLRLWLKIIMLTVVCSLPFGVYFYFYPIYQPDLFNQAYTPKLLPDAIPYQTTLAVVVLPGCPYCEQTTPIMNRLAAQNSKLKIVYYFVSEDPESERIFRKKLHHSIVLKSGIDAPRWMLAAEGVFPSYLLFDNKQLKRAWHNTTFGVRALDELRAYK